MKENGNKAPSWVWIVLVIAVIASLGCGMVFGCAGGYLLGQRTPWRGWEEPYEPEEWFEMPRAPRMPDMPDLMPRLPDVERGAMVVSVTWDSPADRAGIQRGDLITAVNGEPLTADRDLAQIIQSFEPGDTITLTVWRAVDGETLQLEVELGERKINGQESVAFLGVRVNTIVR